MLKRMIRLVAGLSLFASFDAFCPASSAPSRPDASGPMRLSWRRTCRRRKMSSTGCWSWPASKKTISWSIWAAATAGFRSPPPKNTARGGWASTSIRCASPKPTRTPKPPASSIWSTFKLQDALKTDVSNATVVTTYLLSASNLRLRPILTKQMKPGSRIVTHNFSMGDWAPEKSDTFKDATAARARSTCTARMERCVSDRLSKSSDCSTSAGKSTRQPRHAGRAASLRFVGPRHARRDRRHDRQRQDRPRHRRDRRSGDRRHAGDRDRSEGRPRQPAAHLPATRAGGFRAVGRCRRGAPGRPDRRGVCRRRSGEMVEGPGRVGPGRRAHRAAARRRGVRALHAGQHRRAGRCRSSSRSRRPIRKS